MRKLCPRWKVYHEWMGCDPFDKMLVALCKVTVNEKNEMSNF